MDRDDALTRIEAEPGEWDLVVIGGGATGLGVAVDSAARGYRTLLIEQSDFAKATSSRSTKLIHGGFRYLKQGNLSLVLGALRERGLLKENAPHLVHSLRFVVPAYARWEKFYYGAGLKIYDRLAGRLGFGRSRVLSRQQILELLPGVEPGNLRGGIEYFDGQFDDARLAIALAQTVFDLGGVALNYCKAESLLKESGRVRGVVARDLDSGREFELRARTVINATGVFTDFIRRLDDPQAAPMMTTSQGAHIVLDESFLPGGTALMVPKTADGRVLFAIPWHGRVVVGTTETPSAAISLEPKPLREEINFLLDHAAHYLARKPSESDIRSVFAGLRPLVRPGSTRSTAQISRDHSLTVSASGLVTITGGKWTTYRKMAEETVTRAASAAGLPKRECKTRGLHLHGWTAETIEGWEAVYGSDGAALRKLMNENVEWSHPLHARLAYRGAEVIHAVRHEMARSVDDVLARRTRALIQDARASIEMAPQVANLLAGELGRDARWESEESARYIALAQGYLPEAALRTV
jgi:glycerol-3-phosphate dehydrogenase